MRVGSGSAGGGCGWWGRQWHRSDLHGGHSPLHQLGLLEPVLQLLLTQLVLDVQAEWDRAFVLLTVLRMVAA